MRKEDVLGFLTKHLRDEVKVENDLGGETDLREIGLDSLDIVNLLFAVEDRFGIKIPDEDVTEKGLLVLDKMAEYICGHMEREGS